MATKPSRPLSRPAPSTHGSAAARLVGTVGGVGLLPLVPGTWGSLIGVGVAVLLTRLRPGGTDSAPGTGLWPIWLLVTLPVAALGVWASGRTALDLQDKDPPRVVIDEVSGQLLTYAGCLHGLAALNWKSILGGFILFRVFDVLKPFPARRAEWLPGGWGIMADDWVAGGYAALALWLLQKSHSILGNVC
jgi:phosphatidylglycerophosphatase A